MSAPTVSVAVPPPAVHQVQVVSARQQRQRRNIVIAIGAFLLAAGLAISTLTGIWWIGTFVCLPGILLITSGLLLHYKRGWGWGGNQSSCVSRWEGGATTTCPQSQGRFTSNTVTTRSQTSLVVESPYRHQTTSRATRTSSNQHHSSGNFSSSSNTWVQQGGTCHHGNWMTDSGTSYQSQSNAGMAQGQSRFSGYTAPLQSSSSTGQQTHIGGYTVPPASSEQNFIGGFTEPPDLPPSYDEATKYAKR